jgi:DNA-binding CsgD family transcriptional regulator
MNYRRSKKSVSLTPKEKEVLDCIKQGKCTSEIADTLSVRQSTVKFHVRNIMDKLDASNRAHAVAIALEKGLLES